MRWLFQVVALLGAVPPIFALGFDEALQLARDNALELREFQTAGEQTQHEVRALDGIFDARLGMDLTHLDDQSAAQASSYDRLQSQQFSLYATKAYGWGGRWKGGLRLGQSELSLPATSTSAVAAASAAATTSLVKTELQLEAFVEFAQPLRRNLWAQEVRLQQQVLAGKGIAPRFRQLILRQKIQAEAESLLLQLTHLREQVKLAQELLSLHRQFVRATRKRIRIGRADQIDVAMAETQLEAQKGRLLDLVLDRDKTEMQVFYRLYPTRTLQKLALKLPSLNRPVRQLAASNAEQFYQYAILNRQDLAQLFAAREPLQRELALIREQGKAKIDLFANLAADGVGEDFAKAQENGQGGDHLKLSAGLRLELVLGDRQTHEKERAAASKAKILEQQADAIKQQIRRDVSVAFLTRSAALQRSRQAAAQIRTFDRQIAAERKRFLQARSDNVVALRYKMDRVQARMTLATANWRARASETQLRHLSHGFKS